MRCPNEGMRNKRDLTCGWDVVEAELLESIILYASLVQSAVNR